MSGLFRLAAVAALASPVLVAAYLVDPPSTAASDTIQDCTSWYQPTSSDTCQTLADWGFITLDQLYSYNPSLSTSSCDLTVGNSYCVEENYGVPVQTSSSKITTSTSTGISTPTPIQTGMVSNCISFYKVVSGDSCAAIATNYGISVTDFYSWNPAVKNDCTMLIVGDYVCVGTAASTISTTMSTTSGNGISTPTPIQTGIASNCDEFYLVQSGDSCAAIAASYSISVTDFYSWNPAVKSDCTMLIVGDYVCVGTKTSTVSATTVPTTSGNGISTPTPIQTGMVSNCNKFYLVQSGDSCAAIAEANSISTADLISWNPAVKSDCTLLLVADYVCVGTTTSTISATITSSTTSGNGISTPTPIQTGMVSNCISFYKVASGDSCSAIAEANGISTADLISWNPAVKSDCTLLLIGDYVCVGTKTSATSTTKTSSTTAGNGISTPTPIQTGTVSTCNKFYLVKSGDSCSGIAEANSISTADLISWNPAVKSDCTLLLIDYYVCVGIVGGTTATRTTLTTSTTSSGNGITTPTPTQTGMVSNCRTFHFVVSGDTCADIAKDAGISVATFYEWNPSVNTDCSALWLNTYVCIATL